MSNFVVAQKAPHGIISRATLFFHVDYAFLYEQLHWANHHASLYIAVTDRPAPIPPLRPPLPLSSERLYFFLTCQIMKFRID